MKKLIVIACLSFTGIVISSDKYPNISSHFPTKSLLRKQCEENERATWSDEQKEQIAIKCEIFDKYFPFLIKEMRMPLWLKMFQSGVSADSILKKREWIKESVLTKKNVKLMRTDIDIILDPLNVSEKKKRKEMNLLRGYMLMTAEHE